MRIFWCFLAMACLSLGACKKDEQKKKERDQAYYDANDALIQQYIKAKGLNAASAGNGTFYSLTSAKPTAQGVQDGDSVRVHFKAYVLTDVNASPAPVDTTSEVRNLPDRYLVGNSSILQGLEDAIRLMKEGEEATILIPSYRAYGTSSTSKIPPYTVLRYELKLVEVKSEEEQILAYIAQKNLTVTEQKDQVRRIQITAGSPDTKPSSSLDYTVLYEGRLLNDFRFDKNADSSYAVNIASTRNITGFSTAVSMMNMGETSLFIFPSSAAYGRNGVSTIPSYAPLTFKITLLRPERLQLQEHFKTNAITDTIYNSSNGVYHKVITTGTGGQASGTSRVKVRYKGKLLDGTPLAYSGNVTPANENEREDTFTLSDTSFPSSPWFARGLRETIAQMKVGEKRYVWIPSPYAFGVDGYLNVKRRTPVMFEVELKEIL